jgi:excisionase family DNA binding protein
MASESTTTTAVNGAPVTPLSPLDVLTLAQAAAYLQLPEDAVRAEAEAGRLSGRNIGSEWRFVRDCIVTWLRTGSRSRPQEPSSGGRIHGLPVGDETPEEHAAFLASIQAYRDEIDRATGHGKYAPE